MIVEMDVTKQTFWFLTDNSRKIVSVFVYVHLYYIVKMLYSLNKK